MEKMAADSGNTKMNTNFLLFSDFIVRNSGFMGRFKVSASFLNRGFSGIKTGEAESQWPRLRN
jgi:hypothetical protein